MISQTFFFNVHPVSIFCGSGLNHSLLFFVLLLSALSVGGFFTQILYKNQQGKTSQFEWPLFLSTKRRGMVAYHLRETMNSTSSTLLSSIVANTNNVPVIFDGHCGVIRHISTVVDYESYIIITLRDDFTRPVFVDGNAITPNRLQNGDNQYKIPVSRDAPIPDPKAPWRV